MSGVGNDIELAATRLADAARHRKAINPLSDHGDWSEDEAYSIQRRVVDVRLEQGARCVGAKLGFTSKAKQIAMGIGSPCAGWLTSDMIVPAGESVAIDNLIQPRVEPEIAFLIDGEVSSPATIPGILAATQCVVAALEVLDSRYLDYRFQPTDVIADNASAGRFVLGGRAVDPHDIMDLALLGCVLRVDGQIVDTAAGGAALGHPAAAVAWLVDHLAMRGEVLEPGAIVLSGGLTAPVTLGNGTWVSAEFAELGAVDVVGSVTGSEPSPTI